MNDIFQWAWLIPMIPLAGFMLLGLSRRLLSKNSIAAVACLTVVSSFVISLLLFGKLLGPGDQTHVIHYFDFINIPALHIGFDFQIDRLSGLFLLIITGVGSLIHLYSAGYMKEESAPDYARYFSYLNLFIFFMLMLVMGSNLVILFIGWEGVGLCSYLLIGYWFRNPEYNKAAQKAFVMNRIGDLGFLLAIFWLIARLGTVSYPELFTAENLSRLSHSDVTGISLLLFLGATGKSAQIPLFTWLPDAMAGPTPVSALIHAATMVTAGIYLVARANLLFSMAHETQFIMMIIGLATAFLSATIALRQNDIKKVLAYSTVSQLGLMFLALGAGNYMAAVFHVMTHAFFKALLFLGAGSVIHAMSGEQDLRHMGGLRKHLPITHLTFLLGSLAIAGIPPLSGFFSKDAILISAFEKNPAFFAVALLVSLMTTFYMFRLYAMAFLGSFRGSEDQKHHLHESPVSMTLPLIILAIFSICGGWLEIPELFIAGGQRLSEFLLPIWGTSEHAHVLSESDEIRIMIMTVLFSVILLFVAIRIFSRYHHSSAESKGLARFLENKWYVDEFYEAIIGKPMRRLSDLLDRIVERKIIDGLVNGTGRLVNYGGRQLRWIQNGQVGTYVLFMTLGLIILLLIKLFF
jgi:NADH-quinone oxidoreductase subunit L